MVSFLMDDPLIEEAPEFELIADNRVDLLNFRLQQEDSLGTNYLCTNGLVIRTIFTYTMSGSDPNKGRR